MVKGLNTSGATPAELQIGGKQNGPMDKILKGKMSPLMHPLMLIYTVNTNKTKENNRKRCSNAPPIRKKGRDYAP